LVFQNGSLRFLPSRLWPDSVRFLLRRHAAARLEKKKERVD
jgi:hypothetical protein